MKIKRVRTGVALVLATFCLSDPAARAADNEKLLFLGNKNIAPVVYLENGAPSGVAVDIVHALAQHLPQPVEIRAMDWPQAQTLVAQGKADALIQINRTPEREKLYDFSEPLLESQFSIFVRTDRVGISGFSSLRGLRVGAESGGLPSQVLGKTPEIRLMAIRDFLEGFKLLNEGAIDAVVVDYRVGSYVLAQNNIKNIMASGEPIAFSYSSLAVKKGNTKLLNGINNALRIIRTDGTYQKIIDKWQPKEGVFYTREQISRVLYEFSTILLLILLALAAAWTVTLRKELAKRKTAEEVLNGQYSTLRGIINSANALIFSVDREYRYTIFNQGHAAMMNAIYGVDIEQGHSLLDYMSVPEDRETAKRNLDRALKGERLVEESYSGEELRQRRYFTVSHSPIKTDDGGIIGVAVLAQDITERKRAESEREELRTELLQSQKMESVGRLAGGVAHDFNNLLTAINAYAGFIMKGLAKDDPMRGDAAEILAAGERATRLTRQLLAFSRKQILSPRIVDLNAAVGDTAKMLKRLIGEDIRLETRLCKCRCQVKVDPGQIDQLLVNLAVNARDSMPNGGALGVETAIVTPEGKFFLRYPGLPRGPLVCLMVKDTGCGMTAEIKEHIFEPFFTTKEKAKGTGLGLSTVFGIVKQSGGEIEVESEPGHGATFRIYFPCVNEAVVPDEATAERTAKNGMPSAATETILLVDDEEDIRSLGERILRARGYAVITAANGTDAIKAAERNGKPLDLLITDVVMPDMNGRDLAKELEVRKLARRTLYMSGYTDDAIVKHGVLEPGIAFIYKPFTAEALLAKLRKVLDGPADQANA